VANDNWPATALPPLGWPDYAQTWLGESFTFPSGRGQEQPQRGWVCTGCGSGWSPRISRCEVCGPKASGPVTPMMGDWSDEE
jgi:hypothetical protein